MCNERQSTFSSIEVINRVLLAIGLERERTSTYKQYSYPNGKCLRLRISDHGLFLQYWFKKNKEARFEGANIPKLNVGQNLAITFSLNKEECKRRNIKYPQKISNSTSVKTQCGNNAKPQFSVRHICYYTDMLDENDLTKIINSLIQTVSAGIDYVEPLQVDNKLIEWSDTSNCPPKKITKNRKS